MIFDAKSAYSNLLFLVIYLTHGFFGVLVLFLPLLLVLLFMANSFPVLQEGLYSHLLKWEDSNCPLTICSKVLPSPRSWSIQPVRP